MLTEREKHSNHAVYELPKTNIQYWNHCIPQTLLSNNQKVYEKWCSHDHFGEIFNDMKTCLLFVNNTSNIWSYLHKWNWRISNILRHFQCLWIISLSFEKFFLSLSPFPSLTFYWSSHFITLFRKYLISLICVLCRAAIRSVRSYLNVYFLVFPLPFPLSLSPRWFIRCVIYFPLRLMSTVYPCIRQKNSSPYHMTHQRFDRNASRLRRFTFNL